MKESLTTRRQCWKTILRPELQTGTHWLMTSRASGKLGRGNSLVLERGRRQRPFALPLRLSLRASSSQVRVNPWRLSQYLGTLLVRVNFHIACRNIKSILPRHEVLAVISALGVLGTKRGCCTPFCSETPAYLQPAQPHHHTHPTRGSHRP